MSLIVCIAWLPLLMFVLYVAINLLAEIADLLQCKAKKVQR